jgi:CubicO group peptidase (beta-lactamase class C family)
MKQDRIARRAATAVALAAVALAAACGSSRAPAPPVAMPAAPDPALARRVDAVIDEALAAQQLVGAVVLVARDGKLVYARAVGLADREAKQAVREDTLFRIASMTKPIVSVAALALIDQGKLSLDEPITKWLPDFRPKLHDGREPVITVRHLLTHTSGLGYRFLQPSDGIYHEAGISDGLAEPGMSADENLRRLAAVPLLAEPGTTWMYSVSVDVLGEVIARAAGAPLPEVVRQLVTKPLGMTDTTFVVTDRARLATPYAAGDPPVRMTEPYDLPIMEEMTARLSPARIFDPTSFPSGGGGLASTARDYLRFAEALRTGGAPLLRPETARAMRENQLGDRPVSFLGRGYGFGFGVGVMVDPAAARSPRSRGAFGWSGAYGTGFWVDPEARLSAVVLTNLAGDTPFPAEVEAAIYAAEP